MAPLQAAPIGADIASVPATVTIGSVGLPDKKSGGKELSHALGKDVEGVVRDEVKVTFTALRAFTEVVPEGGKFVLDLEITAARREDQDPAAADDRMPLSITLDGRWTWRDASGVLLTGETTVSAERFLSELPQRQDLEIVVRKAIDELGGRAFADFYASRE